MSEMKVDPTSDDFESHIEEGFFYIDKTEMIYEYLEKSFKKRVMITRPRRFGKTMAMTMLKDFLDIKKDSRELFKGLAIMNHPDCVEKHMNKYPVIFLSLKDLKSTSLDDFRDGLNALLAGVFEDFGELAKSDKISESERQAFENVCYQNASLANIKESIKKLATLLCKHYGKKVFVIVDEYDVPMENAFGKPYYNDVMDIVQSMLSSVCKTNTDVRGVILSGCLYTVKNSGYTGLNNILPYTITSIPYSDCFGFTEEEVSRLFLAAGMGDRIDEAREWYNGYVFGRTPIYNPWDIMRFIASQMNNPYEQVEPGKYWIHTSESREDLIHGFIGKTTDALATFGKLMAGETIEKTINESLPYHMLQASGDNLWTGLLETGYLTSAGKSGDTLSLRIPNKEIREVFQEEILDFFNTHVDNVFVDNLMDALWHGNAEGAQKAMDQILEATVSYHHSRKEYVYQYVLVGFFDAMKYRVRTEYETGYGRSDIIVEDFARKRGLVLELKQVEEEGKLAEGLEEACSQPNANKYDSSLIYDGYKEIHKYGMAFWNKRCMIRTI